MTILDRVTLGSLLFLIGCGVVIFTADMESQKQPIVNRTGTQMCQEVEHELNIQVELGMMTKDHATAIVQRCFNLYGGTAK